MTKWDKVRAKVLSRESDANIEFKDLCGLLERLGCTKDIQGSHHVFRLDGVVGQLSLQPTTGGKAKAYQVDEVRTFLEDNGL